jgi:hypothetical protein
MGLGLKRTDLKALAQAKLDDAEILLRHDRYSNSYYLAGYVIELALKACIAAQFVAETIPDKAFVISIYQHSFKALVGAAGLTAELKQQEDADPNFAANFALVAQWSPDVRYESKDAMSAQAMLAAITDTTSGVLPWIMKYW